MVMLNVEGLLNTNEMCERLKISKKTLYLWIHQGVGGHRMPIRRRGGRIYFDPTEVLEFLGWQGRDGQSYADAIRGEDEDVLNGVAGRVGGLGGGDGDIQDKPA